MLNKLDLEFSGYKQLASPLKITILLRALTSDVWIPGCARFGIHKKTSWLRSPNSSGGTKIYNTSCFS